MPKDPIELQQLKDIVREVVSESHQAVASVQSQNLGDIKSVQAVHTEVLSEIRNYQKIQNGNVARAVKDIEDLKLENARIRTSVSNFKFWGTIVVGILTTLGVYAYLGDVRSAKADIANTEYKIEAVKQQISLHDNEDNSKYGELIKLLKQR
jgi:hypothetical protein